jgi:2-succinyl-6-hydroxy-2,4-cyclohexadiene-1-carboxylate synthase
MPEVVFLPGFMQHADAWSPVAAAVGERYPSQIVDFSTWTFEGRLAEIRAATQAGDVLVGYSMGGRLALHAALREPDRYAGVALVGVSPGIEDPGEGAARVQADEELALWIESSSIEDVVARWEHNLVFASQSPALVAAQRPGRLAHSPADLASLLRSAGQGAMVPVWERLGELQMPVLALAGEHDSKYREAAQRMRSSARAAGTRIDAVAIPGTGHAAHLERPDAVRDALLEWLLSLEIDFGGP